jgi:hypothetical protein
MVEAIAFVAVYGVGSFLFVCAAHVVRDMLRG